MTKEGFTKLTGLKPTDEEFEIINGLYTVINETANTVFKATFEEEYEETDNEDNEFMPEKGFCKLYGKGEDADFFNMVSVFCVLLSLSLPHTSNASFKSFESFMREMDVVKRMLERDYKLSLDDRRLLLEKAKAAAKNITKKD